MKKKNRILFACFFLLHCSQLIESGKGPLDFLPKLGLLGDLTPPRVTGNWPLNEQTIVDPMMPISVSFSKTMHKTRTESAFSLKGPTAQISGSFEWFNNVLFFYPSSPLNQSGNYILTISKSLAEDASGINLERDFVIRFNYNPDTTEPTVVNIFPSNGSIGVSTDTRIGIRFSKPMNSSLVFTEMNISPSVELDLASSTVSPDFTYYDIALKQRLSTGTTYSISVPNSIKDQSGNSLLQTYRFSFTVGSDFEKPYLNSILSTTVNSSFLGQEFTVIDGFEKDDAFSLTFSEPVRKTSFQNGISFTPSVGYSVIETSGGTNTSFLIQPLEKLSIGRIYQLRISPSIQDMEGNPLIKEYVYNLRINGPRSNFLHVKGIYSTNAFTVPLSEVLINDLTHDGGGGPLYNYYSSGSKAIYVIFAEGQQKRPATFPQIPAT